jgi:UDPglucose 6-dehydrogenase
MEARKILVELHKSINSKNVLCSIETAEMIKYASNSLLSTKISFANAMAFLCERFGADVEKVMEGVGLDRRLGRSFLYAGVGYGGSCFPKDVKALIAIADSVGYDFELLKSVDRVNEQATAVFIEKIVHNLNPIKGKTVGILGLAFKPDTDDMREAPSIKIIHQLQKHGAKIKAYDPVAMGNAKRILSDVVYYTNVFDMAKNCDALVIVTEWNEFRQLDLQKLKEIMAHPIIFDGRNIYEPRAVRALGFTYFGVGRP